MSAFHKAASSGDLSTLSYILNNYPNTNLDLFSDKYTALHLASSAGHLEVVSFLIEQGANVNKRDLFATKYTPLALAARNGHYEISKLLIQNGAQIDTKMIRDRTPLFLAAARGHVDVVQLLVSHGAEVNRRDFKFQTPLFTAMFKGDSNTSAVVKFLVENNADIECLDGLHRSAAYFAASQWTPENFDILMLLSERGANLKAVTSSGESLLHAAVRSGSVKMVEWIIDQGCDVNAVTNDKNSPIRLAASSNNIEMVKCLVSRGAQLDDHSWGKEESDNSQFRETILGVAYKQKNIEMVKFLLDSGLSLDTDLTLGQTIIHEASKDDNVEIFKYLIAKNTPKSEFEKATISGATALHIAASRSSIEVLEILLDHFSGLSNVLMGGTRDSPVLPFEVALWDTWTQQTFRNFVRLAKVTDNKQCIWKTLLGSGFEPSQNYKDDLKSNAYVIIIDWILYHHPSDCIGIEKKWTVWREKRRNIILILWLAKQTGCFNGKMLPEVSILIQSYF
ncbi:hypothetical protein HK096_002085 [Nowakowskiella sp. JEL0078]|nr:hypothetical protein HK096_002085 [Nowakowskiella sp. JEL0078]